ncbi:MAG: hypothetical protein IJH83_03525 [Coriobacteriales bacterium]|nr:hypothetical protein [Coriobacteriales bacterium]
MCTQFLITQNRSGALEEPFHSIGRYWYDLPAQHRNGEFDIVAQGREGYVFYEVKFRRSPITRTMILDEIAQADAAGLDCKAYGFFSRSGFEDFDEPEVMKFSLPDLYG